MVGERDKGSRKVDYREEEVRMASKVKSRGRIAGVSDEVMKESG